MVPDAVTLAMLATGLASCGAAMQACNETWRCKRAVPVAAFAIAVTAALVLPLVEPTPRRLLDDLRHQLGLTASERAIVLVGSWSCDECKRLLREIDVNGRPAERKLFVTRRSEPRRPAVALGTWEHVSVTDSLWWQLVVPSPPRVIRLEPQADG